MNTSTSIDRRFLWALGFLLLVVYSPVLHDLVLRWYRDANYAHGFLVPLVSAFLVWRKRDELAQARITSNPLGVVVAAFGMLLFVVGNVGVEYFTVRVSLVTTMLGLVLYLFGADVFRLVWFAIFLLFFMIPIPAVVYFSASVPMQLFASKVSVAAVKVLGIPVFRTGNIIHLPSTSLEVAEACSGLRSLISLLAMGAIYAYLTQRRFWSQAVLFLATVPIAVASNSFRVFITTLITYAAGVDTTQEPLHSAMGASVFVVAFLMLFSLGALLRRVTR